MDGGVPKRLLLKDACGLRLFGGLFCVGVCLLFSEIHSVKEGGLLDGTYVRTILNWIHREMQSWFLLLMFLFIIYLTNLCPRLQ